MWYVYIYIYIYIYKTITLFVCVNGKRKGWKMKHKTWYFLKGDFLYLHYYFFMANSNNVAHLNCQIKFTNCQRSRLEKRHLSFFTIDELFYYKLFKILNKVCSVIYFRSHLYHTDTSQCKSVDLFPYSTSPNWKILPNRP